MKNKNGGKLEKHVIAAMLATLVQMCFTFAAMLVLFLK